MAPIASNCNNEHPHLATLAGGDGYGLAQSARMSVLYNSNMCKCGNAAASPLSNVSPGFQHQSAKCYITAQSNRNSPVHTHVQSTCMLCNETVQSNCMLCNEIVQSTVMY